MWRSTRTVIKRSHSDAQERGDLARGPRIRRARPAAPGWGFFLPGPPTRLGRRLILRCRPNDGLDLARQLGRSLATRWHSEMRAVRLLDGNRLITDDVNNCLPLNHHDTMRAPDKKPQRTGRPLGLEHQEGEKSSLAVFQQCGVSDSVPSYSPPTRAASPNSNESDSATRSRLASAAASSRAIRRRRGSGREFQRRRRGRGLERRLERRPYQPNHCRQLPSPQKRYPQPGDSKRR